MNKLLALSLSALLTGCFKIGRIISVLRSIHPNSGVFRRAMSQKCHQFEVVGTVG